jgi:hypothetical protein
MSEEEVKVCDKCGLPRRLRSFAPYASGVRRTTCNWCRKPGYSSPARNKKWRLNNPKKVMFFAARDRARRNGSEFSITAEDIPDFPEYCPILGMRLEVAEAGRGFASPNSPSLDRIDSSLGYVPGNLQVISNRANWLKGDSTLQELILLGRWAARQLASDE